MKKNYLFLTLFLSIICYSQTKRVFVSPATNPVLNTGANYTGDGLSWENAYTSILNALKTDVTGFTKLEVFIKEGDYFDQNGTNSIYGTRMSTLPDGTEVSVTGSLSALATGSNTNTYDPNNNPTNIIGSTSLFQVGKGDGNLSLKGLNIYDPNDYYDATEAAFVSPFVNINIPDGVFNFEDIKIIVTKPVSDDPAIGMFNITTNKNPNNTLYFKNVYVEGTIETGVITVRENANNTTVEIRDSKFHNNRVTIVPGAVVGLTRSERNTVRIYDSEFAGNQALSIDGGAIAVAKNSTLTVERSIFKENYSSGTGSTGQGGAIAVSENSSFSSTDNIYACNHVQVGQGGAIWIDGGTAFTSTRDTFVGNFVQSIAGSVSSNGQPVGGGAIAIFNTNATITDAKFTANWATQLGGAILTRNQTVTVTNSEFYANEIRGVGADSFRGGAINADGLTLLEIVDSRFQNNKVTGSDLAPQRNGGAITSLNTTLIIRGTSAAGAPKTAWFRGNESGGAGGAVWMSGDRVYTVNNVGFYENQSGYNGTANLNGGGALFFTGNRSGIHINSSDFFNNQTWVTGVIEETNGGGAIKVDGDIINTSDEIYTFSNNRFKGNLRNGNVATPNVNGGSDIKLYYSKIRSGSGTVLQMPEGNYNSGDFPNNVGLSYDGNTNITTPAFPAINPTVSACDQIIIVQQADKILLAIDDIYSGATGNYPLIPPGSNSTVITPPSIALTNDIYDYNGANAAASFTNVSISVIASQSPNVTLDPATGTVSVAPGTSGGTYWIEYRITDVTNPANYDHAFIYVFVPGPVACYKPANTTGGLDTKHGITALRRAGASAPDNWPMARKGGYTVLESNTKGFVINRMTTNQIEKINTDGKAVPGMAVYDVTVNCLKIYDGTSFKCFTTPACDQ